MNANTGAVILGIAVIVLLVVRSRKRAKNSKVTQIVNPVRTASDIDSEILQVQEYIDFFSTYAAQHDEAMDGSFVAQAGEEVIAKATGVGLIETKRGPATFSGGSTGISFRVLPRVSVRQSAIRGRSIPGEEAPAVSDQGDFVITDKRGVFIGTKQSREFLWSKLLSYQLTPLGGNMILYLPVSNRAKVSGIGGDEKSMSELMKRVAFGVSVATGRSDQFINSLKDQLKLLQEERLKHAGG